MSGSVRLNPRQNAMLLCACSIKASEFLTRKEDPHASLYIQDLLDLEGKGLVETAVAHPSLGGFRWKLTNKALALTFSSKDP